MAIEWVDATKTEISETAEQLVAHEFALGNSIPTRIEGETHFTSFEESLGAQPTPMEYMAFVEILLERGGYIGARDIVSKQLMWLLNAYAEGAEPLPVAYFIDEMTAGRATGRSTPVPAG